MLTYKYRTCQDKLLGILEVIGWAAVRGGGEEFFSSQLLVEDEEGANRNQREKSLQ
jgi:hypothetical protein